jgi:predicted GTPase
VTTFSDQRREVLELAADAAATAEGCGDAAAAEDLRRAAADLEAGRLTVAVVGEFKRGKSTLLNALIEEPDLFPPENLIATNLVTTVSYGESERVTVYLGEGEERREQAITREQIREYGTEQGNPGNREHARLLTIELPNERLSQGLTFVDTPGVGGLRTEHAAFTYGVVVNADVVLFVLDALVPLATEELAFLERIAEHCRAVMFVVTKRDKEPDYERIVANTREKVVSVLGPAGEAAPIVAVSSTAKLEYLESGDEEDLEVSNFAALEDALWGLLRERSAAILLLRALGELVRGVDRVTQPLAAELEVYTARTKEELDASERDLAEAAARLDELRDKRAAWRQILNTQLRQSRIAQDSAFRTGSLELRGTLRRLLDDERMLDTPLDIAGLVSQDLTGFASGLVEQLRGEVDRVAKIVAGATGLVLNPAVPDAPISTTIAAPDLPKTIGPEDVAGGSVLRALRGGWSMATIAGTAAGLVGAVLTGPGAIVFAAIGAAAGGIQGARAQLKDYRRMERRERGRELGNVLQPWLEASLTSIDGERQRALLDVEQALTESFDSMLEAERDRVRERSAATKAARRRSQDEAVQRAAALRDPLNRLRGLRERADGHTQRVLEGAGELDQGRPPEPPAEDDTGDWADD